MAKTQIPKAISVGEFFKIHGEQLEMELISGSRGMNKLIEEPSINRAGLALSGFYKYFADKRIQVLGASEQSFLQNLKEEKRLEIFDEFCKHRMPCIVVSRDGVLEKEMMDICEKNEIAVFSTSMITMKFINKATFLLEWDFAPIVKMHGSMVDVKGIGILIRGHSGSGKSESVLGLIDRGASLVADDIVILRSIEGQGIIGSWDIESERFYMEARGIGIVNVLPLYGIASARVQMKLDLVVTLIPHERLNELERIGSKENYFRILGSRIRHVELPLSPGRDIAKLIEVAALDQKLKSHGYNAAKEFLKIMREKQKRGVFSPID